MKFISYLFFTFSLVFNSAFADEMVEDGAIPEEMINGIIKYCSNYKKGAPNDLLVYHCEDANMAGYVEFSSTFMNLAAQSTEVKNIMLACSKEFMIPDFDFPDYSFVLRCMEFNIRDKEIKLDNPINLLPAEQSKPD